MTTHDSSNHLPIIFQSTRPFSKQFPNTKMIVYISFYSTIPLRHRPENITYATCNIKYSGVNMQQSKLTADILYLCVISSAWVWFDWQHEPKKAATVITFSNV